MKVKNIIYSALLLATITACSEKQKETTKPDVPQKSEENVTISKQTIICDQPFMQITHIGTMDIEYTKGDYKIELEGDSTLFPSIMTEFDSGTLTIGLNGENNIDIHAYGSSVPLKVHISSPELRLLAICNKGSFHAASIANNEEMQIGNIGTGNVVIDSLSCKSVLFKGEDSGHIKIGECNTESLRMTLNRNSSIEGNFNVNGNSVLTFTGGAKADIKCKGDGIELQALDKVDVNLDVDCKNLNVETYGTGNISLNGHADKRSISGGEMNYDRQFSIKNNLK